jgi:hypothetical protein
MTDVKRTNLEVVGGLTLLASGYAIHWWQTRNDVSNAVKDAKAAKDKEHAEDLRRFEEQRQKENQMYRSFFENFIYNKGKV